MNRNKKLGKKAVMAAMMAGSLMANLSPVAAKEQESVWKQKAYFQEAKNLRTISNETRAMETVTINMNQLTEGEYNGYNVKADGTIELVDAKKNYVVTGSNVVDGIGKYKIVIKNDVNLTLNNASIVFDDGVVRSCRYDFLQGTVPILVEGEKKVDLLLYGENVLRCGTYSSVIGMGENAELTVNKNSTGRLKAFGRTEQGTDSEKQPGDVFEKVGNQSIGIGKVPKKEYGGSFPESGGYYIGSVKDPTGILKVEGGSIELYNIRCGVALQNVEVTGGSLNIQTKTGTYNGESMVQESPFFIKKEGNTDPIQYTTVKNKDGEDVSLYSLKLPYQKNCQINYVFSTDDIMKNYRFSGIKTDNKGKIGLYLPSSLKGKIYLSSEGQVFGGNIKAPGDIKLRPLKTLSCKAEIKQHDKELRVVSDVQDAARGIKYQWYESDSKEGVYTEIEGATKDVYRIPDGQAKRYYKAKAEYVDELDPGYASAVTPAFFPQDKKEEVKQEEAKKQTKVKVSKRKVKLTWKKKKGAKGYYLYQSTNGRKYKKIKTIKGNKGSHTMTVKSGKTYWYKVKPYKKKKVYKAVKVKKKEISKTIIFTFRNVPAGRQYRIQLKYGKEGSGFKKAGYKTVKKNVKASKGTIVYTVKGKKGYTYDAKLMAQ